MSKNLKGNLILLLAAALWGFAFVAQDIAAGQLAPFSILAVRSFIGAFALCILCIVVSGKKKQPLIPKDKKEKKSLFTAGIICGLCLCLASGLQQIAMGMYPSDAAVPARSGFITALYVVLVPICSVVFTRQKLSFNMVIGILLAVIGLYFLCFRGGIGGVYTGDIVMLACALSFTAHIMCVDNIGRGVDGIKLSCIQFFTCGIVATLLALIFENPTVSQIITALPSLLYLGIFSSGIAYTCQIIGQQYSENPTVASIVMSLESVFAAIGGAVFGDILSARELSGCAIMFIAIIVSQLPAFKFKRIKQ